MRLFILSLLIICPCVAYAQDTNPQTRLQELVYAVRQSEKYDTHIEGEIEKLQTEIDQLWRVIEQESYDAAVLTHAYHSLKKSPHQLMFLLPDKSLLEGHREVRTYEVAKNILTKRLSDYHMNLMALQDKQSQIQIYQEERDALALSVNNLLETIKDAQTKTHAQQKNIDDKVTALAQKHDDLNSFLSTLVALPKSVFAPTQPPAFTLPASGVVQNDGDTLRINTARNAIVTTPARGRVLFAAPFKKLGPTVIIDHGYGYISVLRGFKDLLVNDGVILQNNDPIGIIGGDDWNKDGNSTILIYQLRYNGESINPMNKMTGLD